ncbi:MAG: pantoate--beta-alanine ligase, partial [Acidaminococcaceae bacterium]|nr:pantoate--beta-alanine ligase [Acidaminococcaceae bacterium]
MSNIDYVEMYQLPELTTAEDTITVPHLLAVAVKFGTTRLIDNIILE